MCDFNLSKVAPREAGAYLQKSMGPGNSPAWMGPELLRGGGAEYTTSLDTFSFGVILWEIITLRVPWEEDEDCGSGGGQLDKWHEYFKVNKLIEKVGGRLVQVAATRSRKGRRFLQASLIR